MATKRIIAHFMHEQEKAAALATVSSAITTDSYILGTIDEGSIQDLEKQGLIVQEIPDDPGPPLAELSPAMKTASEPKGVELIANEFDPTATNIFTLRLAGPLLKEWQGQLAYLDIRIIESIAPQLYTAALTPAQLSAVRNLAFVTSTRIHTESETMPPIPSARSGAPVGTGVERIVTFDIRLAAPEGAEAVLNRIGSEALVAGVRGRKIRISAKENAPLLAALKAMPEVYGIHEFVPPKLSNDRARVIIGIDTAASPVTPVLPLDGAGQIVGIADTGIDDQHPDFQGRLVGISALGRAGDHSDPHGHGTHVTGSVAGDGAASAGAIRGTAPKAGIFFQSLLDAGGGLGGLPWDLNDLFDEAYQAGARIHNNSWGADTDSRYTFNSSEADEFVDSHRDMAIVIAAGNEGTSASPFSAQLGFVDWLSIGSPATSKNAITVGASRTDRTSGGYAALQWGQQWPSEFPMAPIASEPISGDAECMAAFSSRGPCDDRRIKPDVVAPGTDIVSTKSSRAPGRNFWGSFSGHGGRYAYMGGTSMATPIVSGCLALIRQYYADTKDYEPSAALLKATLVNGTRWLTGRDSTADFPNVPNFHQGFGRVHMPWTIPNTSEPNLKLEFIDTWKNPALQLGNTGARTRHVVTAGAGRPLRFCLAYTDIPARALQNNLNLFVHSLVTNQKWVGNQGLPQSLSPVDNENNVEIVRIENPPAGEFLIQITATNLLGSKPQDFALVVTGDLGSAITPYP